MTHCCVCSQEATYGTHVHEPRDVRETRFTSKTSLPVGLLLPPSSPPLPSNGARHSDARGSLSHPRVCPGPCSGAAAHTGSVGGGGMVLHSSMFCWLVLY